MLRRIQLPNGVHLAYQDAGAGTAVFLIHGHPFDHTMWAPQVEFLAANYRVVVPDLRGYGATPLPKDKQETLLEDFVEDILALADHLAIARFAITGLSLGGQIVLETWRQAPERIRALVLADTFAGLDTPEQRQGRLDAADRLEREGMAPYANEVLEKMLTPAHVRELPAVAEHVMRMMTGSDPIGAAAAARGRCRRRDYLPLLAEIQAPTMIVVGSEDLFTPVALAEEMHRGISGSQLRIIPECGHMPNLERPEEFNAILGAFLGAFLDALPAWPVDGGNAPAYA
jgi:pimeloyl-ACP methyl ester carboxylesterase